MNKLLEEKERCSCLVCGDMYTDPKRIECGHLFCHQCLLKINGPAECPDPKCRMLTVPERGTVAALPTDMQMVDKIKELVRQVLVFGAVNPAIGCDQCSGKGINGPVFVCGTCADYDLCERCESLPRCAVHWADHIFLKVKRTLNASKPKGATYLSDTVMKTTQRFGDHTHEGSRCDSCGTQPIIGTRFKCAMCDDYNLCERCEKRSLDIHDEYHVFIVVRHACTDPPPGRLIQQELFDKDCILSRKVKAQS